jgi:phospholipase/carboxylesterase
MLTYEQAFFGAEPPQKLMVMLHGYGADATNLISLADEWKTIPGLGFYAVHAPDVCEEFSQGRQWFSLRGWDPTLEALSTQHMLHGLEQASTIVVPFLMKLLETHGLQPQDLVLMGFSQGAMMALHLAFQAMPQGVGGVIAFSGAFFVDHTKPFTSLPPALLVHGEKDMVVSVEGSLRAKEIIKQAGGCVTLSLSPFLDHSIDGQGVQAAEDFLKKLLIHETI